MDKDLKYRSLIKTILLKHAQLKPSYGDIKPRTLFDEKQNDYLLMDIGWNNKRYVYGNIIHLQLLNNKIWIHYDGTEEGIAMELVDSGVPKTDIVLGFRHPKVRQYTDFSIA